MSRLFFTMLISAFVFCASAESADWTTTWAEKNIASPVAGGAASSAALSIVTDGQLLFLEGYGSQDSPNGAPIDPNTDRFAIASITKTFTALAVAQLVETGLIASLDDPANKYLKRIRLPEVNGVDVTLRHLLTHSAGFEESNFGFGRHAGIEIPASASYAQAAIPEIVRTPGAYSVYANIDPPILAMLVEDLTGKVFKDYLHQHILKPFSLHETELNYNPNGGKMLAHPWRRTQNAASTLEFHANAPFFAATGSIEATAADMGRYAIEMMEGRTISDATRSLLFDPLAENHPALDAFGMFWYVSEWNGVRIIEHAGGLASFGSWLILIPERRIAMFFGWAGGPTQAKPERFEYSQIRDSFLAAALGPHDEPDFIEPQPNYAPFEGRYWSERRPQRSALKLLALDSVSSVEARPDGLYYNERGPYRGIGGGAFASVEATDRAPDILAFENDKLLRDSDIALKVSGLSDPTIIKRLAQVAIIIGLTGIVAAFWPRSVTKWAAINLAPSAAALPIVTYMPSSAGGFIGDSFMGVTWRFDILFLAGLAYGVIALLLLFGFKQQMHGPKSGRTLLMAAHYGALTLAAIGLFAFANYIHVFNIMRLQ